MGEPDTSSGSAQWIQVWIGRSALKVQSSEHQQQFTWDCF